MPYSNELWVVFQLRIRWSKWLIIFKETLTIFGFSTKSWTTTLISKYFTPNRSANYPFPFKILLILKPYFFYQLSLGFAALKSFMIQQSTSARLFAENLKLNIHK